jgi:predicted permease
MLYYVLKVALTAAVIVAVSEIAKRHTALAALLAALPLTSLLAFVWFHLEGASAVQVAALSRGIFWLVLPSLVFFVLFPTLLERGVSFWWALVAAAVATGAVYAMLFALLQRIGVRIE